MEGIVFNLLEEAVVGRPHAVRTRVGASRCTSG